MTDATTDQPLTGRHVAWMMIAGFGVIIAVNLTLAFQAVGTFPGLETRNSYVASQSFEARRQAQQALGWQVTANHEAGLLHLSITRNGTPVAPKIQSAVLGRATHVAEDQFPELRFNGQTFTAPADLGPGNWNLRLVARAADGTLFRQRVIVRVAP